MLAAIEKLNAAMAGLKEAPVTPTDKYVPENPPVQKSELPKKNAVYKVNKLYYTITKSSATAGTVSVKRPVKKTYTSITIPKTVKINGYTFKVTAVGKKAFSKNNTLRKVTIGGNVTSIGKQAFANDKNLRKVVVKSTKIKTIKKSAFKGIAKKAVIDVPNKKSVLRKYKKMISKSRVDSSVKVK